VAGRKHDGGGFDAAEHELRGSGLVPDTFEGMSKQQAVDVSANGQWALTEYVQEQTGEDSSAVRFASLSEVRSSMASTGYNPDRMRFVRGKGEKTIPSGAPETIALLRLETDRYESTRHELEHLFPRLAPGGILIFDDYGAWPGARKATDEFIESYAPRLFLNWIDDTGRLAVKTS
jgi:hypothetical protein